MRVLILLNILLICVVALSEQRASRDQRNVEAVTLLKSAENLMVRFGIPCQKMITMMHYKNIKSLLIKNLRQCEHLKPKSESKQSKKLSNKLRNFLHAKYPNIFQNYKNVHMKAFKAAEGIKLKLDKIFN